MAIHADREAVDVDGGTHDSVVTVATGASQVPVRPVEQTIPQRFFVLFEIRQPIDKPRLSRLTGESLFDDFFSTSIPSRHPHRGIVCESIEIILMLIPHRHRIESFAQEFCGGVANSIGLTRIEQLISQRFSESELMIELAKQNSSGVRSESLINRFDFYRPIEFRLEQVNL